MDYYKLENKEMDETFLKGLQVTCKAVIPEKDYLGDKLKEGSPIVVMLSNGKKYMGQVVGFSGKTLNGFAVGELIMMKKIT